MWPERLTRHDLAAAVARLERVKFGAIGGTWSRQVREWRERLIALDGITEMEIEAEISRAYLLVWRDCPWMRERLPEPALRRAYRLSPAQNPPPEGSSPQVLEKPRGPATAVSDDFLRFQFHKSSSPRKKRKDRPVPVQHMPETVTAQALADLLDVSPRHLRRLADADVVARAPGGGYFLGASVRGYSESVAAEARRRAGGRAEDGLRETKRRALERRAEREDRSLISRDEAVSTINEVTNALVEALKGVPDAIGRRDDKCTIIVANAVSGLLKRRDEVLAKMLEGSR